MTSTTTFSPDWISPPGDTIDDLLEERGWTQAELATRASFTTKHVNELIKGRATLTPDAAERLSRVLGSTVDFWLVREAHYRARLEERDAADVLVASAAWLEELPLAWMCAKGWVRRMRHKGAQVAECLRFFGVASVDGWRHRYQAPLIAFRASSKLKKERGALSVWLRQAEREADKVRSAPFNKDALRAGLDELRSLTREHNPKVFVPDLVRRCAAHGVAVVFVPAPPGCPVSGATRWLTPEKALLALSLRHKSNDHLWFTFFHEAGHLILHGKKLQFIDGIDGLDGEHEAEADDFAANLLIRPRDAENLRGLSSAADVDVAADRIGVAPGIVVGRMQREGWLPWSHLNGLKVRYSWAE